MKRVFLSSLILLAVPLGSANAQSFDYGDPPIPYRAARAMPVSYAAPSPQAMPAPRSNLGGGFIEFLFSGGDMPPDPTQVVPRYRSSAAQPDSYPVPRGRRYAYALPPSAATGFASASPSPIRGEMDARFAPQEVDYDGPHKPGTIVIDTSQRFLYLVEQDGKAMRYGVGVGREGFEWKGTKTIERKAEWPDWRPPAQMLMRRPDLPTYMAGGPSNPLGARAMYLAGTLYRIHGSNEPQSIGHAVSSGCIRMRNEDVIDLYDRVKVGTTVIVM